MNERVYRFYYIQRGNTAWEFEDFYERGARTATFVDVRDNIVDFAFADGIDDFLPDKPPVQAQERIKTLWDAL